MTNERKEYGFIAPSIVEEKEFKLGQLAPVILQPTGQWTDFLPLMEDQRLADGSDSYACTAFGTHNAVEILFKRVFNLSVNLSDRFLAIISKITPPGADPHTISQNLRHFGAVDEFLLSNFPACANIKAFYFPDPLPRNLTDKGIEWLNEWSFGHEWVASGENLTPDRLKFALTLSPICVALYAWASDGERYFRPPGSSDTHWATVVGYKDGDYWLVFDSIEGDLKKLRWDFKFWWAKRYSLKKSITSAERLSIFQKIVDVLKNIVAIFAVIISEPKPLPPRFEPIDNVPLPEFDTYVSNAPEAKPEPKYKWDTPAKARHSVRVICDEEGLSVDDKNILCAVVGAESGWDNSKINRNTNGSTDWGLCQFNDGPPGVSPDKKWWIGTGRDFANVSDVVNNPERAVRVMIREMKKGRISDWTAYKNKSYLNFL